MQNSIKVVGYADAAGNGAELSTAFTEADFENAKRMHRFPDGVKHLELIRQEKIDSAIFINDGITQTLAKSESDRVAAVKAAAQKTAALTKDGEIIAAAQKKVRDTARARNDLMGRLHQAKAKLANHDHTPPDLRGKAHEGTVKEVQKLIFGDPEKKVAGLEAQVKDAVAAYDVAAAEFSKITKPINAFLSPAPKSQFVEA
jgi:hypothetical protein